MIPRAQAYLCVISMMAACGGADRVEPVAPQGPASPASAAPGTERGASVQYEPIDLQVALQVRGSRQGELRDGDIVQSGDRIQLTIQTREASHVYLAYCSRNRELTWFPSRGSIMTRANELVMAPAQNAAIVLDDNLGPEALYVVVSQFELPGADPELAKAIETSRGGGPATDCGQPFSEKSSLPPKKPSYKKSGRSIPPSRASNPASTPESDRRPPEVGLVRGGYISWDDLEQVTAKVDAAGIAILRYGFKHVARSP